MKLKSIYIYLILLFVGLLTLILLFNNQSNQTKVDHTHSSDVTQNMLEPNKMNVNSSIYNQLQTLEAEVFSNPEDTLKIREYADLLSASHSEEKAMDFYKKILSIDSKRTDIIRKCSIISFNSGNYEEAKSYIVDLISINPSDEEALYNLGVVETRLGDIEAAKKQWQDLITNHPNTKMSDMAKESLINLAKSK